MQDVTGVDDHAKTISMAIISFKRWRDPRISTVPANLTSPVSITEEFFTRCLWSPTFVFDNLESVERWDLVKEPRFELFFKINYLFLFEREERLCIFSRKAFHPPDRRRDVLHDL